MKKTNSLRNLPSNTFLFIDSNIFIYFLTDDPIYSESCKELLERVEEGDLVGFINNIVITETLFAYIKSEVVSRFGVPLKNFGLFAKKNQDTIKEIDISLPLSIFSIKGLNLINLPFQYLTANLSKTHQKGLLPHDAYHLISLWYIGIAHIATNDSDFQEIGGIQVWQPEPFIGQP
ncbi:MAG: PIN domain-containing protein [bacterium]